MAASALPNSAFQLPRSFRAPAAARRTTLLDLVRAVSEVTSDEREVVATVRHLLETGQVVLCGNFRGERLGD